VAPLDVSDVLNEIALRFRRHPASGEYKASKIASGQYRLSGTCTLTSGGVLTDSSATFVTDGVAAGERIYISGDQDYVVDSVTGETALQVSTVSGDPVTEQASATDYWLGPNLNGTALLSQFSYKTVNALGVRQERFTDDGGYKSDLIADDDTAELLVEHLLEWFANPRDKVEFPVFHSAVDVQLGDVVCLDHPLLRATKKPRSITTVSGAHNSSTTTLQLPASQAGKFREDDYLLITSTTTDVPEAVKVTAVNTGTDRLTVSRGQLNTVAQAWAGGETIYRLETKWMVTGVQPPSPDRPYVRLRCEQMPRSYFPTGRVVASGYADYDAATAEERQVAGWASLHNGRVVDQDPDSALSFVG
jgi:hypothetical protein